MNTSSSDAPPLNLASVTDNVLGDLTAIATAAGCGSLASGASCSFSASRVVQAGDPNPLVNTVSILYHPEGFPNDITDSASHSTEIFAPSLSVAKTGTALSKVGDPASYTFSITNTSTPNSPNLALVGAADNVLGSLMAEATAAGCASLPPGGSCSFSKSRVIQPGDSDPLINTFSAHYNPVGWVTDVTASASHTTNLFQPSVAVDKSGPALAKVGDSVTYSFTITNTSSADSPALNLASVSDTIIGSLMAEATAAGCASLAPATSCNFTKARTVLAGDPDPLVNTVSVLYHPQGFPNDIAASDSHSLNLFQPSLQIVKNGDDLGKIGDPVNYTFIITNTSSSDTPPLVLNSVIDPLIGNLTAVASGAGCSPLASGASCTFGATRTVMSGDPDPLVNTVTATYTPDGTAGSLSASASHTTNLFQPSVSIVKTGPSYALIGQTVTYNFAITNTSSPDSPPLQLAGVTDSVIGDLTALAMPTCSVLPPGASCGFTADYTVLATDADPLVNTVGVLYHPAGFPNNITATSKWSVNILHPDGEIDKTCLTDPVPPGASANFRINVYNTGDVPLITHLTDSLLGIDMTFDLGVQPSAGYCTEFTNDPIHGCFLLEVGIISSGGDITNSATIDNTLPPQYGIPGVVYTDTASATCTGQSGGATRTLGFWATHLDYTSHVFFTHLAGTMNIGWKILDGEGGVADDVFGIFWANNAKDSKGKKRSPLCQARETVANQVVAAILNSALTNGAPLPVSLSTIQSIMAGTDINAIRQLGGTLDTYNQSGDSVAIVDGDGYLIQPADPNASKNAADIPFADCP